MASRRILNQLSTRHLPSCGINVTTELFVSVLGLVPSILKKAGECRLLWFKPLFSILLPQKSDGKLSERIVNTRKLK